MGRGLVERGELYQWGLGKTQAEKLHGNTIDPRDLKHIFILLPQLMQFLIAFAQILSRFSENSG